MPFRAKDILLAALSFASRHPGLAFLVAVAGTLALQAGGFVGPGDWWGDGLEIPR